VHCVALLLADLPTFPYPKSITAAATAAHSPTCLEFRCRLVHTCHRVGQHKGEEIRCKVSACGGIQCLPACAQFDVHGWPALCAVATLHSACSIPPQLQPFALEGEVRAHPHTHVHPHTHMQACLRPPVYFAARFIEIHLNFCCASQPLLFARSSLPFLAPTHPSLAQLIPSVALAPFVVHLLTLSLHHYSSIVRAVEKVNLHKMDLHKMPNELSGGMLRRAALVGLQFLVFQSCFGHFFSTLFWVPFAICCWSSFYCVVSLVPFAVGLITVLYCVVAPHCGLVSPRVWFGFLQVSGHAST
jgi:hypothetical protein